MKGIKLKFFINKYFTQFIPGKQEGYGTTTESLANFTASASSLATEPNKDKDFTPSFGNSSRCERRRQILLPFPPDS